jgi:deoxyribonuclease-4
MRFVNHPVIAGLPLILETPNELPGYRAEIEWVRKEGER